MNRLQLAQRVHLLTGAGDGPPPGSRPTTTLNQPGDLARMVVAVDEAWRAIQTARKDWLFMFSEGTLPLVADVQRYALSQKVASITSSTTTATLTVSAGESDFATGQDGYVSGSSEAEYNGTFALTRTGARTLTYTMLADPTGSESTPAPDLWLSASESLALFDDVRPYFGANRGDPYLVVYKTSLGQADEQPIHFIQPFDFEGYFDRNAFSNSRGRPVYYTVLPNRRLAVFPWPDDDYTVRLRFRRRVQLFAADNDEPNGLPDEFHPIIAYKAIMDFMGFNENSRQFQNASRMYSELWEDLCIQQLPRISSVRGAVR